MTDASLPKAADIPWHVQRIDVGNISAGICFISLVVLWQWLSYGLTIKVRVFGPRLKKN
jgi:hypothetical protein